MTDTPEAKLKILIDALQSAAEQLDLDSSAFADRDDTLEANNCADAAVEARAALKKVTGLYQVATEATAKPVNMTIEQFIEKFGPRSAIEINDNCLTDKACPECGSRGGFNIGAHTTAEMYDDGSEETHDLEWEDDSHIDCRSCNHSGTIADFTFDGLDDKLKELEDV